MEISIKWSMCRTCMAKRCSTLRPLIQSQAAAHLIQYAGIVVDQDDGLPDQICKDCVDKLEQFHRFIGMCTRSDEHLRNIVSKTMSSTESFKTTSDTDGSPPIQRKRPRKQELSGQTRGFLLDDETPEVVLESDVSSKDLTEESEMDEINWLVLSADSVNPDNELEATSSQGSPIAIDNGADTQGSPIAIDNGADSQEVTEEETQSSDNTSKDQHKCEICTMTYPKLSQLKSHLRKHSEKSHECEVCSKRFNAACNLTAHMRTHTGEKPFQCAYCTRRFADHSSHRKHERIHTNERPYSCRICGKAFALSTSLKAHHMTHSSEKAYKCVTCMKSFRLKHQLIAHLKTEAHRLACAGLGPVSI